ncbi:class I SAM-dependent methyltransferase [Francisella philomiragia]|uniref:class I SAM-dependent methyltransferase n=1 Tax=Francisella philomiragia TaxID=28110 RepID=UPI001903511E|nr:class I SAM-dependent methyltransferase [Francisella philomiragia]MBK2106450.1 class I SAM-dependent methyltransferase [Francisella philomiragia]
MKRSKKHTNRKLHNWIIYKIGDKFRAKYSKYYKGQLVDLGCGEAPYRDYFLQYADSYIGVDWTKTLHNSKADIVSNLNEKIDLRDKFADTIISLSVMEHLCEPQVFLNESFRVLKDDGVMILQVPWQWLIHEAPHDYFRYTPYGLKYLFGKAGFKNVEIEAQSGFFTMWIVKMNYFTLRLIRGPKLLRKMIKAILVPFWMIGQTLAPYLDKLDKNWLAESQGYYVIARKK